MCCFARPVISVNNTQIFARRDGNGNQLLAYQMSYESQVENAMILPVPVRQPVQDSDLRFIDVKEYDDFFRDLDKGFPHKPRSGGIGCGMPETASRKDSLQVFQVGNYVASFVPTLADFSRLDDQFKLPQSTWEKVPEYSAYGFAVFQLAAGSLKPHPMAFEFKTDRDDLYFPTVHIHDGEIHPREHFDHVLYLQHAGFDSRVSAYRNSDVLDAATNLIRSARKAQEFCDPAKTNGLIQGDLLVHRQWLRGQLPNEDTFVTTVGHPTKPSINLRRWLRFTPWLIVLAAIGWFFRRRNKIGSSKETMGHNGDSISI